MNGYQLQANAYRQVLAQQKDSLPAEVITDMETSIRVFDVLAEFGAAEKYAAFNSSMFNDILRGYVKKAIDTLADSDDAKIKAAASLLKEPIDNKVQSLLDCMTAKEAEEYFRY